MRETILFQGQMRHRRFSPKRHQFAYGLFMFCVNLADIDDACKQSKYISREKLNWFSFQRKNYLTDTTLSLDDCARQLVMSQFGVYPSGNIYLLTHLTCLGYCFNPISLYFVLDERNQHLAYLILEVTNTPWGERHHYVLRHSDKPKADIYVYQFQKAMHVSPFMAMHHTYQLKLKFNQRTISLHMENHFEGKKHFDASLMLHAQKNASIKKVFWQHPFMTYKITLAIYWQALKLWMKGVPFHSHPGSHTRISNGSD